MNGKTHTGNGGTVLSGKVCERGQGTCSEMLFSPDFDEKKIPHVQTLLIESHEKIAFLSGFQQLFCPDFR